jgi:hypothetical protein
LLLGVGVIHLIETTELISGEMCLTVCIAISRRIQHERNNTEKECDIWVGGEVVLQKTGKARIIIGKTQASNTHDSQYN